MSFSVKDKVCVVTGGAAGVGAGIVRTLLNENARVVVFLDIAEKDGDSLENELLLKFGALTAKFIKCDVSNEKELAAALEQVKNKYHRIDVVINNAAILSDDSAHRKIIDVNLGATVHSTLKSLDMMSVEKGGGGGVIVNLSSQLALKQDSNLPVYSATKLAILHFSNSIGTGEIFSKTKVRIVTVCLGPTDTAIIERHNLENFNKACAKNLTSRVPIRQRVQSAVNGIVEVIKCGKSGSTWIIANDKPAADVTEIIKSGFDVLCQYS